MNTLFKEFDETPNNESKSMGSLMDKYQIGTKKTKHEYEFQEVCSDLEKDFGKLVWTLPHKIGFTPHKIKKAGAIARKRGVLKFPYLVGIIKNLPDW